MSDDEQKPESEPKSRFVAEADDLKFVTREESDTRLAKRRAEIEAFREERRRKSEEQRKRKQKKPNQS